MGILYSRCVRTIIVLHLCVGSSVGYAQGLSRIAGKWNNDATGENIVVAPTPVSELKPFDIIVFWNQKVLICHYFWHINRFPGYIRSGEHVPSRDSLCGKRIGPARTICAQRFER